MGWGVAVFDAEEVVVDPSTLNHPCQPKAWLNRDWKMPLFCQQIDPSLGRSLRTRRYSSTSIVQDTYTCMIRTTSKLNYYTLLEVSQLLPKLNQPRFFGVSLGSSVLSTPTASLTMFVACLAVSTTPFTIPSILSSASPSSTRSPLLVPGY